MQQFQKWALRFFNEFLETYEKEELRRSLQVIFVLDVVLDFDKSGRARYVPHEIQDGGYLLSVIMTGSGQPKLEEITKKIIQALEKYRRYQVSLKR